MKLRNKKTGKIVDFKVHKYIGLSDDGNSVYEPFNGSIDEWEDVPEEPKEFWFVDDVGEVKVIEEDDSEETEGAKQIGNYFSSREEAELAVRKLKAWKRLKDDDFKFIGWYGKTYLVRCPKCKKENYAMAVSSGVCCWCGYDANKEGGEE